MHEAGAAVVAAQLLAFCREPVRYRPRLTHGREPFSGGLLVFRFAQGRFPQALMRDLPAARRESLREAALFFIRQVCFWEGASHYQVLCVAPGARREIIKEHYHGLMALIHPDRQEGGASHWPAEYAQRVNKAYEVLSDEARRREYDAGLQKETMGFATLEESLMAAPEAAAPGTFPKARSTARARMRKPVLFVSLALSLLFFVQVWWAGEVPGEYSAIPSAAPFELSLRWMREAYSSGQKPPPGKESRPSKGAPDEDDAKTSFLAPLWKVLSGSSEERVTPRTSDARAKVAPVVPSVEFAAVKPQAREPEPAPPPARRGGRAPFERAPERIPEKASLPVGVAHAAMNRQATERKLTAVELESVIARVVTYYEAGDTDKLLGLYDPGSVGLWEAMSLRHDFEEFFRATKARRLRLQGVSWDTASATARVKGAARLVAEYHDEPVNAERQVAIEMDIVSREGEPRIARLSLFPHERLAP
jgi:curved DNA-binding protein CbpA